MLKNQFILNCKKCGNDFDIEPYRLLTAKYCSRLCQNKSIGIGRIFSAEVRKKIADGNRGKKISPETIEKIRQTRSLNPTRYWLGRKLTDEHKAKMSLTKIGKTPWNKGTRLSPEHIAKLSGENANNWQGGKSTELQLLRHCTEYKLWRTAVFERDNYTCVDCGVRNIEGMKLVLNADHIKPFAHYPELRFAIDNGQTLCLHCHKLTATFGNKARYYKEKITA